MLTGLMCRHSIVIFVTCYEIKKSLTLKTVQKKMFHINFSNIIKMNFLNKIKPLIRYIFVWLFSLQ